MLIELRVKQFLDRHNLSAYRLAQETAGKLAPATVYSLAKPGAKRVDLETFGTLIATLRRLTGEPVTPNDLLELIEEPDELEAESRAWMNSDLSRLGEFEPYDWGDLDPMTLGEPVRYEPAVGIVVGDLDLAPSEVR